MVHRGINVTLYLCTSLCIASLLMMSISSQAIEYFLNTDGICGSGRGNVSVMETAIYNLKINVKNPPCPDKKCSSVFQSARNDGRICILLVKVKMSSCNIDVKLYDGKSALPGKEQMTINCNLNSSSMEWCTAANSLTLVFTSSCSVTGAIFDVQLYDIGNTDRKAYMDKIPYCGSRFDLFFSTITISNMAPDTLTKDLLPACALAFEFKGIGNKTKLCVEFLSFNTKDCIGPYARYKLDVQDNNFGVQSANFDVCQSDTTSCFITSNLTLTLKRGSNANVIGSEPRDLFTIKVFDRSEVVTSLATFPASSSTTLTTILTSTSISAGPSPTLARNGGDAWSQRGIKSAIVHIQCALTAAIMKQL